MSIPSTAVIITNSLKYCDRRVLANSVDQDQMPQYAAGFPLLPPSLAMFRHINSGPVKRLGQVWYDYVSQYLG